MTATAGIAFVDTETITLDPGPDVIWEVAIITRDPGQPDQEWRFQLKPNLNHANPESLKVCRFDERYTVPRGAQALAWTPPTLMLGAMPPARLTYGAAASSIRALLDKRHIIGAVPSFDTERLSAFLCRHAPGDSGRDPWHYHLCDVENLIVGYLRGRQSVGENAPLDDLSPPWNSEALSRAVGVEPPGEDARHSALGDARWVRDLYDAVMGTRSTQDGDKP